VKSPHRGITQTFRKFIIPRVWQCFIEGGHDMLQWKNGRLLGILVVLAIVAMAIGNWGWHITWGWS
jgi:hypothetical protein